MSDQPRATDSPNDESTARRRASRSIHESLAVEAGAGTGKTTLLVTRIVNLLRFAEIDRSPRPVRIGEIVAITFTEKAAGELKTRLRDTLESVVATGQFECESLTADQQSRLSEALQDLDRAVVATIHSFCAGMIRERPVEARIDPGRSMADALTQSLLFDEAWQRWREGAYADESDTVLASALRLELKADRRSASDRSATIRDLATTLVNNRDLLDYLPAPIDEQSAWQAAKTAIDQAVSELSECLKHLKNPHKPDRPGRFAHEFIDQWRKVSDAAPADAALLIQSLKIENDLGGNQRQWRDTAQLDRLRTQLELLRDQLMPDACSALTHNALVGLIQRLLTFVEFYESLKRQRGLLDFQDLLLIARDMLRSSAEALEYFRDRYRFLLIDEFQDTDPLQAEVAMLLTSRAADGSGLVEPGRLFLVGDPKQSIYRFRRADIEVFDRCTRAVGPDQPLRIRQNFRSGSHLIQWVNRLFGELIRPSGDGHYQREYSPLLPGPAASQVPGRVVLLPPPDPSRDCNGKVDTIRYREGCCIALFIQHAVRMKWASSVRPEGLRLGDVAVLLPQMTGLASYEEAFRACGLRYHLTGGRHFYQRFEVRSLLNVLSAIDDPEDAIAIVGALRSPFFGCSDEDLLRHALAGGSFQYARPGAAPAEPLGVVFELLRRLHRERNQRPIAAVLIDLFDSTKILENLLTKPQGESRVANLMRVVDSARAIGRGEILTFRGFVRWLRERQSGRDEEFEGSESEPGDDAVRVLTVHKAKGLEFPMTVIADLQSGDARPDDRLIFDRINNNLQLRCGPLSTAGWRNAQRWDLVRVEAERRRLFYVAATRARDYLVLPAFWRKRPDSDKAPQEATGFQKYLEQIADILPPDGEPPWDWKSDLVTVFDTRQLLPWPEAAHAPQVDFDEWARDPAIEQYLQSRAEWQRGRDLLISRAAQATPVRLAGQAAGDASPAPAPVRPPERTPGGPEFGTLVHRLLELRLSGRTTTESSSRIAAALAAALGLPADSAATAVAMVDATLNSPIASRLKAAKRLSFEVPFAYADGEAIVEGRIDVLAEESSGLLLIDFKTDAVNPGDEPVRAKYYAHQLRAYAAAVHAASARSIQTAVLVFLRTQACVEVKL